MITHNGTYLPFATHHGMPIQAATMGGKMVFGSKWLLPLTQQAIVAAFGSAEGTEVIAKTNDYLNRIATTDPQRAQLLAGFINEDPMLVCSLVETSKTRWLVGDGASWIDTDLYGGLDTYYIDINIYTPKDSLNYLLGNFNQVGQSGLFKNSENKITFTYYSKGSSSSSRIILGDTDKGLNITTSQDGIFVNGLLVDAFPNGTEKLTNSKLLLWGTGIGAAFNGKGRVSRLILTDINSDIVVRALFPTIRNGENGMLDIISGTFHPNANTEGSFTITLTDKA